MYERNDAVSLRSGGGGVVVVGVDKRGHSLAFGKTEPAVWLISNCFSGEYFFLDFLFQKRNFSELAFASAGSVLQIKIQFDN